MEIEKQKMNEDLNEMTATNGDMYYLLDRSNTWEAEDDLNSCKIIVETYISSNIIIEVGKLEESDMENSDLKAEQKARYQPSMKQECFLNPNDGRNQVDQFCSLVSRLLEDDPGDSHEKHSRNIKLNRSKHKLSPVIFL